MEEFLQITKDNIEKEHICCAISDKKCAAGYQLKKQWLKNEFDNGYVFRRIDARAKVFIEYGPAENAWIPITAPGYFNLNCFWVSGQYKGKGYGKKLLKYVEDDAIKQEKNGLVTVAGSKKFHFMSDTKWLLRHGFEVCDQSLGFSLLVKKLNKSDVIPMFNESVKSQKPINTKSITVYYSNRCPFTDFHVNTSLIETAKKRNLSLEIHKLETMQQAQLAPSPATIFSLFYKGEFITTDVSVCMDTRFDKILEKHKSVKK